jgi:hypothetical protein
MYNPLRPSFGYNAGFYNPGFGVVDQGYDTMNSLGSQIGNAFGRAAAMSSANYQSGIPLEQERVRQQGMSQRLQAISPLLASVFGFGGGGSPGNIRTDYGAGVSFGGDKAPGNAVRPRNQNPQYAARVAYQLPWRQFVANPFGH